MPDPTEELRFKQQGTDLPKGAATALDEGLDEAAAAPVAQFDDSIDQEELPEFFGEGEAEDIDAELFGPTDHPERPVTHGAGIGPGQNFTVLPRQSDRAIMAEAATRIIEMRDSVPSDAVAFAMRVLAGE